MARMDEPETCPSCKVPDAKKCVTAASFSFAHVPVGGPRPQNTGVHSIDYNADRVIGRDAERRWKTVDERGSRKDTIIRDERKIGRGVSRDQLVRTSENDYRVITEPERKAANVGRALHQQALATVASDVSGAKKA